MTAGRIPLPPDADEYPLLPGLKARETQPELEAAAWRELECSMGAVTYNERANIARVLDSIVRQKLTAKRLAEVTVASSAAKTVVSSAAKKEFGR